MRLAITFGAEELVETGHEERCGFVADRPEADDCAGGARLQQPGGEADLLVGHHCGVKVSGLTSARHSDACPKWEAVDERGNSKSGPAAEDEVAAVGICKVVAAVAGKVQV
jgi:hypothetical protein